MKIHIFGVTTFILAAVGIPAVMAGCDEPQVQCQVGHATSFEYVMQYTVTQQGTACMGPSSALNSTFFSGSQLIPADCMTPDNQSACTQNGGTCSADMSACSKPIPVNHVAFEDYHPATGLNTRDVSQTTVYIETDDVQGEQALVECFEDDDPFVGYVGQPFQGTDQPWETGNFANQYPDANNMCQLSNISPATGFVGTIAAANPAPLCGSPFTSCAQDPMTGAWSCACTAAQPENCCDIDPGGQPDSKKCHTGPQKVSAKSGYDWENVQFYTTADAPGTQFSATLTYNVGGCQATIAARGVWPSTDCTLTDASGNPTEADGKTPLGMGHHPLPNPLACCPNADVDHGHPSGSQINGNFNVHCDPDVLLCVLNGDAKDGIPVLDSTGVPDGCAAETPIQ